MFVHWSEIPARGFQNFAKIARLQFLEASNVYIAYALHLSQRFQRTFSFAEFSIIHLKRNDNQVSLKKWTNL